MKHAIAALLLLVVGPTFAAGDTQLRLGSKNFTESIVLAEILRLDAIRAGLAVEHRRALGGSAILWKALQEGSIDAYPEYSGTLTAELLKDLPANAGLAEMVAPLARLGLGLGPSLGFDDSYALGIREDTAQKLALRTIGDLKAHPELRLALSNEFMNRADGWPGLRTAYELAPTSVQGIDHGLAYRAIESGAADVIDLYTTDAEIERYKVRVLDDDRHHFPSYEAVWLYRFDAAERLPALLATLERLGGRINREQMRAMNAEVKFGARNETDVAAAFLGITDTAGPADSLWSRLAQRSKEHLRLVGISLALALLAGLPLGILAAKQPRFGQATIALTALLQTLPSLALFVFLIPLLGIGAAPAIAALFLYSLLPIIRNTQAGLLSIDASLRESAAALGLPCPVQLLRIELPLASRTIIAGISTAAVINVGTATLGALIGAGGFGEPILTGIRLDNIPLILEGAIPASLLALLVLGFFQGLERLLSPRGL